MRNAEGPAAQLLDLEHAARLVARESMEAWLEANCEKGVGLRGLMARVEGMAKKRH